MAKNMKTRRYKKMRVSSKKRKQTKPRTKRHGRRTRKVCGGAKRKRRRANSDLPPIYQPINLFAAEQQEQPPFQPEVPVAAALFAEPPTPEQEMNILPTPATTPVSILTQTSVSTPPSTPMSRSSPPQLGERILHNPVNNNGNLQPLGNLSNAFEDAYMESITTPQEQIVRGSDYEEAIISPLPGYENVNNDFMETDEEDEDENI